MIEAKSLLPSNASRRMRALSLTSAERRPLDSGIIRRVWDPDVCPQDLLPFLAHALSVDTWDPKWPEDKQRRVIRDAIRLHRLKGTLAGLEGYAELVDSEVIRAVTPPGTFYLSGGLGDKERARLLERMPQIRIYRRSERSFAGRRLFLSAHRYSCVGGRFVADSRAAERRAPRYVFAENGIERPVSIEEVSDIIPGIGKALFQRALLRRPRRKGVTYFGRSPTHLTTLDPRRSVASYRTVDGAPGLLRYGMHPVSIDPEKVSQPGHAGRAMFCGRPPHRRYLGGVDAPTRIYDRIVIWDPELVPRRRGASFFGVSRLGVAPYTAELSVSIPGKRPRKSFGFQYRSYIGNFFVEPDREKYHATFRALRAAKAVRDRILVNTTTYRSPTAGTLIVAGTPFIAGRLLRS